MSENRSQNFEKRHDRDLAEKELLSHNDVFLDIIRLIDDFPYTVSIEMLAAADPTEIFHGNTRMLYERRRDVFKKIVDVQGPDHKTIAWLGIENQTKKDRTISIRTACYDVLALEARRHEGIENLAPVGTIVISWSLDDSDSQPESIVELLNGKKDPSGVFFDWKPKAITLSALNPTKISRLQSDLKFVAQVLRSVRMKEPLPEIPASLEYPFESVTVIANVVGLSDSELNGLYRQMKSNRRENWKMIDFVPSLHYQEKMKRQFQQQHQADLDIAFENGCEVGFEKGREIGFENGQEVGYEKGSKVGFEKGREAERIKALECFRELLSGSDTSEKNFEEILELVEKRLGSGSEC